MFSDASLASVSSPFSFFSSILSFFFDVLLLFNLSSVKYREYSSLDPTFAKCFYIPHTISRFLLPHLLASYLANRNVIKYLRPSLFAGSASSPCRVFLRFSPLTFSHLFLFSMLKHSDNGAPSCLFPRRSLRPRESTESNISSFTISSAVELL